MDKVTQFLSAVKPYRDGDFVDRLNSFYTVISLVACTVIVSGWSFVGSPIQCWFPAYFKGWWIQYSLDYCYVQNTYFLPFYNKTLIKNYWDLISSPIDIPMQTEERDARLIGYYQWVPFILALVAICFFIPTAIWRALNKHSAAILRVPGISVKTICDMTSIVHHVEPTSRRKNVDKMVRLLDHSVVLSENLYGNIFMTGHYISGLYLITKGLFLINAIVQFLLLQVFLGAKDNLWGLRVTQSLVEGSQWEETGHFPRVTVCDFEVRELGNLHRHSVQCVLMINMFNEKIFLFLWWWFLILIIVNALSLLSWLIVLMVDVYNVKLIRDYLNTLDYPALKRKEFEFNLKNFMKKCLRADGVFLLRLISCNSGDAVSREMVDCMWRRYQSRYLKKSRDDDHNSLSPGSPYDTTDGDSTFPIEPTFTQQRNEQNPTTELNPLVCFSLKLLTHSLLRHLLHLITDRKNRHKSCKNHLLWKATVTVKSISVQTIASMAMDTGNMDPSTRGRNVHTVATHIRQSLELQRELRTTGKLCGFLVYGKHYGAYVTSLYLFIKFLYILNVFLQFLILNKFLGPQYTFWGFEILRDLAYGREWQESGHFPRVTMCDFDVRVLGNLHRWTVQCVLMINMFNEKIYLFLWWWFLVVSIVTVLNFFYWIAVTISQRSQFHFISRYLRVSDNISDSLPEQRLINRFLRHVLRPDGVFLLRIIATNAGDIITTDLVHELWQQYREKQRYPTPPILPTKRDYEFDSADQDPYRNEKVPLTD
ncbi:hypothetical protein M514_02287 [Trichuris suis]|uniref:Innexin n=1 Tax=Trichuris suis TaxID=68888 RepID=A0A085NBD9_9BILA|nr:hypothetical protein M514_02287 [Trichuris suis]